MSGVSFPLFDPLGIALVPTWPYGRTIGPVAEKCDACREPIDGEPVWAASPTTKIVKTLKAGPPAKTELPHYRPYHVACADDLPPDWLRRA